MKKVKEREFRRQKVRKGKGSERKGKGEEGDYGCKER